jgi:hypothetical protein
MPRMDGTGPEGKGSGTGRRLGRCRKNSTDSNVAGRGRRQGNRRTGRGEDEKRRGNQRDTQN